MKWTFCKDTETFGSMLVISKLPSISKLDLVQLLRNVPGAAAEYSTGLLKEEKNERSAEYSPEKCKNIPYVFQMMINDMGIERTFERRIISSGFTGCF